MQGMTRWEGIRSSVHALLAASGWEETQLSKAMAAPMVEPPQIKIPRGAVKGAYWGRIIAVPSRG